MNRKIQSLLVALFAVTFVGATARAANQSTTQTTRTERTTTKTGTSAGDESSSTPTQTPNAVMSSGDAQSVISSWPTPNKTAASMLIDKYGQPDAVTDQMLLWQDRTPYHAVAVYRDSQQLDFPTPHQTYIKNAVNYKVPSGKVASLVQFDPAITVDLSRGTLAAEGDSEKSNIVALNLADEIITGKRTVASARSFMRSATETESSGRSSGYGDRLLFTPSGETNVPEDQAVPGANQTPLNEPTPSQP